MDIRPIGILACAALAVLAAADAKPASAGTVTGTYVGTVTGVGPPVDSRIAVNDPFSITFSYDDATPDSQPGDPTFGEYYSTTMTASGTIGSFAFSAGGGSNDSIGIVTGPGTYHFGLNLQEPIAGDSIGGFSLGNINVDLTSTSQLLPTDALPSSYLAASLFHDGTFTLDFIQDVFFSQVTGPLTVAATPIPAALPLFMSALGGIGLVCWRTRRRPRSGA
jgi:hypothetical protein